LPATAVGPHCVAEDVLANSAGPVASGHRPRTGWAVADLTGSCPGHAPVAGDEPLLLVHLCFLAKKPSIFPEFIPHRRLAGLAFQFLSNRHTNVPATTTGSPRGHLFKVCSTGPGCPSTGADPSSSRDSRPGVAGNRAQDDQRVSPQDRAQRFTRSEDNQEKPADPALRIEACGRPVDPPGAALVSTDGTEDDEIVGDQQSRI